MTHVVFVAPVFMQATLRFVTEVGSLPNMKLSIISHDRLERLPKGLQERLSGHYRVANCLDPGQLVIAAKAIAKNAGPIHRLFGALEELQVPLAQARDYLKIEGLNHQAAQNFRDKARMKAVLRQAGIPCARYKLVHDPQEAWAFIKEVGFPIIIKPPAGAGARQTFEVQDSDSLNDYLAVYAPSAQNPALLEEFIQGDEHSFETISIKGRPVWHSLTHYYPNPLQVLRNPFLKWCIVLPKEIDHPRYEDIRLTNNKALSALGMHTGLTHLEWFRRKDGSLAISEVAARPPGAQIVTLMSIAHEMNFYHAWAKLMVFDTFEAPQRKYSAGAAFLRGVGSGKVKKISGIDRLPKEVHDVVVEAKLPQIGQFSGRGYEGDGYVLVRHPDTEAVKKALLHLVSTIQVHYE